MKKIVCFVVVSFLFTIAGNAAEDRLILRNFPGVTFTGAGQTKLIAVSMDGKTVTGETWDGQTIKIPFANLSPRSQQDVKQTVVDANQKEETLKRLIARLGRLPAGNECKSVYSALMNGTLSGRNTIFNAWSSEDQISYLLDHISYMEKVEREDIQDGAANSHNFKLWKKYANLKILELNRKDKNGW